METTIRLHLSELTENALARIREAFGRLSTQNDPELVISLEQDFNTEYFKKLDSSIRQYEEGNIISFTMEEFEEYAKKLVE